MSVPHDAIERFDQRVIGAGNVAGATGASAHTGRGFRPWRRSPSDAGPCRDSRSSTRSRPGAGRPANATLRVGNDRRCARDPQRRGSAVPRATGQVRRKRNDHKSWSEVSVRFVLNDRDFAEPNCSHAPSILSHRSSALGRGRPALGRGDRPQGATAKGRGAGANTWRVACIR